MAPPRLHHLVTSIQKLKITLPLKMALQILDTAGLLDLGRAPASPDAPVRAVVAAVA